jgi:hypothetical protein
MISSYLFHSFNFSKDVELQSMASLYLIGGSTNRNRIEGEEVESGGCP